MLSSDLPDRFVQPFAYMATAGFIRPIPLPAQTPTPTDAPASLTEGFPPITADPIASGGIPPNIEDFNGVLNQLSADVRWTSAGGNAMFDATFSTAVGGYPKGAILLSTSLDKFWISTAENNTTDPDGGSPANWRLFASDPQTTANSFVHPNGAIEQWGKTSFTSTGEPVVPTTLPIAYSNGNYGIQCTPFINSGTISADTWIQLVEATVSTTGFSCQYQRGAGGTNPLLDGYRWRCIGY